jgi:putative glutamine amidotransferase
LRPIVGIPASVWTLAEIPFHGTAHQYLRAVREEVGATVFTIPSLRDNLNAMELLGLVDGILLTGSFSDVHPSAYGEPVRNPNRVFDRERDAVTLPLVRAAFEHRIPILGICRGMQEINVALGGSLHQNLQELSGRDDHRSDANLPLAEQFRPAHEIRIVADGLFAGLVGARCISVNTSHTQAVAKLAGGLRMEATSKDGTIEALTSEDLSRFIVGVQFHPEWGTHDNALYVALFRAFRDAVSARAAARIAKPRERGG